MFWSLFIVIVAVLATAAWVLRQAAEEPPGHSPEPGISIDDLRSE